jgi:hypothetical protein
MAHRKHHRKSHRRTRGLGDFGALPSVFGLSLPLALVAGFVGYKIYQSRQAAGGGVTRPSTPSQLVEAVSRATMQLAPATTPGASVPGQLTPGGRSADIRARIKGGYPINQIVGSA